MSSVRFTRRPYTVTYYKDGEKHTIRRRPPEKLHEAWPEDIVSFKQGKGEDWLEGEEYEVRHINPRHPNVIQLDDGEGNTTFVEYMDVQLEEANGKRDGTSIAEVSNRNRYLLWP